VYITRASFDRGYVGDGRPCQLDGRDARSSIYVESGLQPALFLATYLKSPIA